MRLNYKKILLGLASSAIGLFLGAPPVFAQASIPDLEVVFSSVISVALTLTGIGTVIMLVVGGFQFLTAGGDKEATQRAGKIITFAITGLVLVLLSWLILNFLGYFLGIDFTNFTICLPGSTVTTLATGQRVCQ